jgi:hypothetical protein
VIKCRQGTYENAGVGIRVLLAEFCMPVTPFNALMHVSMSIFLFEKIIKIVKKVV